MRLLDNKMLRSFLTAASLAFSVSAAYANEKSPCAIGTYSTLISGKFGPTGKKIEAGKLTAVFDYIGKKICVHIWPDEKFSVTPSKICFGADIEGLTAQANKKPPVITDMHGKTGVITLPLPEMVIGYDTNGLTCKLHNGGAMLFPFPAPAPHI